MKIVSACGISACVLLASVLLLAACKSDSGAANSAASNASGASGASGAAPAHASITNEVSATADVVAVDSVARTLTLRRDDGNTLQIKAGSDVRNFAQIAVGDKLSVKYQERMEASLRPKGEPAQAPSAMAASARADSGAKPGAGLGIGISVRVRVESIDREQHIVTFSHASGELVSRRVVTAEGREFIKRIKVGDTVQLDYTETVALSIDKL